MYRYSEPATRMIVYLYEVIETIESLDELGDFDENGKLQLFDSNGLDIYIEKTETGLSLVSGAEYIELPPFSIKLGTIENPFNKRVVNELRTKIHKVINSVTREDNKRYINFLIEEKTLLVFDFIKNSFDEGIITKLCKRHYVHTISEFWKEFCETNGIDGKVEVTMTLTGHFDVSVEVSSYANTPLMRTYRCQTEGDKSIIKSNLIKTLRECLQK